MPRTLYFGYANIHTLRNELLRKHRLSINNVNSPSIPVIFDLRIEAIYTSFAQTSYKNHSPSFYLVYKDRTENDKAHVGSGSSVKKSNKLRQN